MRNLQASDLFSFCRIMKTLNLKDELKQAAKGNTPENAWDVGYDILYSIFEKAVSENAEQALYVFLAGIFETDAEGVATMDPIDLIDGVLAAASPEKWKEFFTRAANLMK